MGERGLSGRRLLVALCLLVGPAVAAEDNSAEMRAMRSNCVGDYFRYCRGMNPFGPEVRTCFHDNRKNLTAECMSAIEAWERRNRAQSARP